MNTKKLLKQCQAMQRKQETARQLGVNPPPTTPPPPVPGKQIIVEVREEAHMTPIQLEQYLTQFLNTSREAARRYEEAVAAERYPNSATQDIMHALEFAPSLLENLDLTPMLQTLRQQRRAAKQELEVTDLFQQWAEENKQAINKLEQTLGQIRKVLRRQPNDMYRFKTNIIGEQGQWMQSEEPEESQDPQISIYEYMEGAAL